MTARPVLHIVAGEPSGIQRRECAEEGLRALLRRLDEVTAEERQIRRLIAEEGRAYADMLGEKMLPTVERLRRELL